MRKEVINFGMDDISEKPTTPVQAAQLYSKGKSVDISKLTADEAEEFALKTSSPMDRFLSWVEHFSSKRATGSQQAKPVQPSPLVKNPV